MRQPAQRATDRPFTPPPEAAVLYEGSVMHARMRPAGHRFAYRVFSLLIDLDRLAAADRQSRLFSVGRWNLFSFNEADHGGGPLRLRAHVDALLRDAGRPAPARLLLLCYPRILGFVFDPLSVYYAYDRDGRLDAVVYEVRNTFGERHTYVAPVEPGELGAAGLRQERDKLFYVSPFIAMAARYHFRLRPPGDGVAVRILETDADGPLLAATFHGIKRRLDTATLLRLFVAMPLMTLKVIGGIHAEALRLWLKGVPYYARPAPTTPVSHGAGARPTYREAAE